MIAPSNAERIPLTDALRERLARRHAELRRRGWIGVFAGTFTALLTIAGVPVLRAHPEAIGDFGVWTSLLMMVAVVAMAAMGTRGAWRQAATFARDLASGEALRCVVRITGVDAPKRAPLVLVIAEDASGAPLELVAERRALLCAEPVWAWSLPTPAHAIVAPTSEWLLGLERA